MQRSPWLAFTAVLFVLAGSVFAGGDGQLEGTWVAEKGGKKIELRFAKGKFVGAFPGGKTLKGTYKTDASKTPKQLDITFKETDPKVDGKTAECIYEVNGDTLKWAANDPTRGTTRPEEFPVKDRPGIISLTLKRAGK